MAHNKRSTLTGKLSRDINTAYEAYKANEPGSEERLMRAFVEQARNIARSRLGDVYDGTVAYDAAARAMLALENFKGKSRLSTWFYRIVQNESFSELSRLLRKRETEESMTVPVLDGEADETRVMDFPAQPPDQTQTPELAKLKLGLPPEQIEVLDLKAKGMSLTRIAKKLGLPIGTIRSRYRLAKDHIRKAKN